MKNTKFNLLDGFIVIILAGIIATGIYIYSRPEVEIPVSTNTAQTVTAEYQVRISEIEPSVATEFMIAYKKNETLECGEKERFTSKITNAVMAPSVHYIYNEDESEMEAVNDTLLYDITLTLETSVTETDTALTAENTELRIGDTLTVKGNKVSGIGQIISLKVK